MATREAKSFCRICSGGCGTALSIDDETGRIISVRGDAENPMSAGYACFKGLQAEHSHHGNARLLHPHMRSESVSRRVHSEDALDRIAARTADLIERHGPQSIALFCGNGSLYSSLAYAMHRSFLAAIGSDQFFSTLTIDQSSKWVSFGRLGGWAARYPALHKMDSLIIFGANPLVSHGSVGWLHVDPTRRLKSARAKGLKVIVVDPRRSETAVNSDLLLQPYPGFDAAIAGGILRTVLERGWHDQDFCATHVGRDRLEALFRAVEPLLPERVEQLSGLKSGDILAATEMLCENRRVRCAHGATGPSMQPFSNLAQHMIDCLNVVFGGFLREGDAVHTTNVLAPPAPLRAEVTAPGRGWEAGGLSRIRGYRSLFGERPTGTLADEILTPGDGQIRALFVSGGNPLTSFPDQRRTLDAMKALDLLVAIEPWPVPHTKHAHFVLPPTLQYERSDLPLNIPGYVCWPGNWAHYTPAIIPPPNGADVVHEWYVYWAIAKRLGVTIDFAGKGPLDMAAAPECDVLIEMLLKDCPITLEELKLHPSGTYVDLAEQKVLPPRPEAVGARFDPMPDDVARELEAFLARVSREGGAFERDGTRFDYLLSTRRMRDLFNSNGSQLGSVRKRTPYNPAYLNPEDLARLGVTPGDRIEITSAYGRVMAIVAEDKNLRPGVISIAHGWGAVEDDSDPAISGTCVNLLIDLDRNFEPINSMPHMSAVPVNLSPVQQGRNA